MADVEIELTDEIKREIGQHFVFGFNGIEPSEDVVDLICQYYVGNIILMKRNVKDIPQVRTLVSSLQLLAKEAGHVQPLMIGIDQENGLVSAFSSPSAGTQFPGAMALAAADSLELTEQVSAATAKEMHLAGINWAYSPVCDVNSDPRNPVIGVRSFGDDPYKVGRHAAAVSSGLISSGVASCPKHFPGHGDTHVDSHLGLPRIEKTREELELVELIPFRRLIADDVPTIMTGHMALPLVTGSDVPCSLSSVITTSLLRKEMKFTGVITTDCLEMDAVAKIEGGVEGGAVEALKAGADIVMICHRIDRQRGALEATYKAVREGRLSLDELKKSGTRIKRLKERFAPSFENTSPFSVESLSSLKVQNTALSQLAYQSSVTLVQDSAHVVPLASSISHVLVFTPAMEKLNPAVDDPESLIRTKDGKVRNTAGPSYISFTQSVAKRTSSTHFVYGPQDSDLPIELSDDIAAVIFATRNADRSIWQIDYLKKVLKQLEPRQVPMVVVATSTPYEILSPISSTISIAYLASFEFTSQSLEATIAVIFGETVAKGKLPVRFPAVKRTEQNDIRVSLLEYPLDQLGELHQVWNEALHGTRWGLSEDRLAVLLSHPSSLVQIFVAQERSRKIVGFAVTTLNKGTDAATSKKYLRAGLSAILVLPSHQSRGIGTSLHHMALSYLRTTCGSSLVPTSRQATQLSAGAHFPRIWPGVPGDLGEEVIEWFRRRGWPLSRKDADFDYYRDLPKDGYTVPVEIMERARKAGVTFGPIRKDQFAELGTMKKKNWGASFTMEPEPAHMCADADRYQDLFAAYDEDGNIIGSCVACDGDPSSLVHKYFVWPLEIGNVGCIAALGLDAPWRGRGVGVAFICSALEYVSKRGVTGCFVEWSDSEGLYEKAGFKKWAFYRTAWGTITREVYEAGLEKRGS